MDQIQKSHQSTSVGQEIINYKHMVLRTQKFFGENYIINFFVGKGFDSCMINLAVNIDTLSLFCKYYRYMKILSGNTGNADAGSLDGQDFGDLFTWKPSAELLSDFVDQINIHLMIQKAVYFQYIAWFYHAIF